MINTVLQNFVMLGNTKTASSQVIVVPTTTTTQPPVPVNTVAPVLDDNSPVVGQTLGASEGTWTGSPTSFAWLWYRDNSSLGITTETRVVVTGDIGHTLKRRSIATNGNGDSDPAFSNVSDVVLSNDTSLSVFKVDNVTVTDNSTTNKVFGTASVDIIATTTNVNAVRDINGSTGPDPIGIAMATGDNTITIHVVAADDTTTADHVINIHVLTAGVTEKTWVTTADDVAGNRHGKTFEIRKIGNVAVQVAINCGAQNEQTEFDFAGLIFLDFITGTEGKYVLISDSLHRYCFWFNFTTESQPNIGAPVDTFVEVDISPFGDLTSIADGLRNALVTNGFTDTAHTGANLTVTDALSGPRTDADSATSGAIITILAQGRNAATNGDIIVNISENDTANTIAIAMTTACDGQGWAVDNSSGVVHFEDAVVGARNDAFDVNTGFSVSVVQQGVDPV